MPEIISGCKKNLLATMEKWLHIERKAKIKILIFHVFA
jgi:hypothetical protein